MQIKMRVREQIIEPLNGSRLLIELSRRMVWLDLSFDAEWDGASITVLFENDRYTGSDSPLAVVWNGDPIAVPEAMLVNGRLRIACVGLRDGGLTRLATKRMTAGIVVYRAGGVSGFAPGSTQPELWEQLAANIGDMDDLNTQTHASLVEAVNELVAGTLPYELGSGLQLTGNVLSVDTDDAVSSGSTLPVSSGAVYALVGDLTAILAAI